MNEDKTILSCFARCFEVQCFQFLCLVQTFLPCDNPFQITLAANNHLQTFWEEVLFPLREPVRAMVEGLSVGQIKQCTETVCTRIRHKLGFCFSHSSYVNWLRFSNFSIRKMKMLFSGTRVIIERIKCIINAQYIKSSIKC